MIRIVHILNQFFAGIGGEEKADIPVAIADGAAGAARGLQAQLAERGQVVATIYFGDNYFHEHKDEALPRFSPNWRSFRPMSWSPVRRSMPGATGSRASRFARP